MKKVNYEKVVSDLNQLLNEKYQNKELRNMCPWLESEELRTYFTLGFDNYERELIYFSNMIVYSSMVNTMANHTEEDIKNETIIAFNQYIEAMSFLKL